MTGQSLIRKGLGILKKKGVHGVARAGVRRIWQFIRNIVWRIITVLADTSLGHILPRLSRLWTALVPGHEPLYLSKSKGLWTVKNLNTDFELSVPGLDSNYEKFSSEIVAHVRRSGFHGDEYLERYFKPSFVELESGDVVFDVGGFIGGFSLLAIDTASEIYTFEPDPENYQALKRNVGDAGAIHPENLGMWNENSPMKLQKPSDFSDSTFLDVPGETTSVPAQRLDVFAGNRGINEIDFLKLDVEGAEIEVLEGASEVSIKKIAVDCSERYGSNSTSKIKILLEDRGYTIRTEDHLLYARQENQ